MDPRDRRHPDYDREAGFVPCRDERCRIEDLHPHHAVIAKRRRRRRKRPAPGARPAGRRGRPREDVVTERAAKIRALLAEGMTQAQAASTLGISPYTLKKTLQLRRADPWYPRPASFFQE